MGRFTKVLSILSCIAALGTSLAVIVFLILGLAGVFPLESDAPTTYRIQFVAGTTIVSDHIYTKGEAIITDFEVPVKEDDEYGLDYRFIGWDLTGEGIPDIIPHRAYTSFSARAVYRASRYPKIESSSEEGSSEYESETFEI